MSEKGNEAPEMNTDMVIANEALNEVRRSLSDEQKLILNDVEILLRKREKKFGKPANHLELYKELDNAMAKVKGAEKLAGKIHDLYCDLSNLKYTQVNGK